jgi:hypothetical protein
MVSFRSSRNGTRSVGPRDSGRTVFFPIGTDRPARRRPAALDRHRARFSLVPFHGPTRLGRVCVCRIHFVPSRPISGRSTQPGQPSFAGDQHSGRSPFPMVTVDSSRSLNCSFC